MVAAVVMGLNDFRTLRTFFRFADAGGMPAPEVAQRAADLLQEHRPEVSVAMSVIETIRGGMLPSQVQCRAAFAEVSQLFEQGEREAEQLVQRSY